ncbi:MAG: transglutaminase-like domain-containing protein [Planctomycetia bacterium]|nr:transglutaminase-like domain-containing protein [Planctomycetia bacterium]
MSSLSFRAAIVACCALLLPAPFGASVHAEEWSLPEFARSQVGREAFGLYLAGKKTGYMLTETRLATRDGHEVLEVTSEWTFVMRLLGAETKSELQNLIVYSLEGDGEIVYAEELEKEDETSIQRKAVRNAEGLKISTTENGATTERQAGSPRDTLVVARDLEAWLKQSPQAGDKHAFYEVTLGEDTIDRKTTAEFLETTQIVWGGVPVAAHRVQTVLDGSKSELLIDSDGRILRGKMGLLLEIRAEEEATAKQLDAEPVDMLAASAIPVDQPLGDGETIEQLTLKITALDDFELPQSARQHVEALGQGAAQVTLEREPEPTPVAELSAADKETHLRATPSIQSDAASIRELAATIVGDETDPIRRAELIVKWIGGNLRPSYAANASTATAVLERKAGDCTEYALLFTALARAAGVPARQIGGVVYTDDPKPLFAWHAWAEIHDGHGWVSVDPMWQQVRIDPTHIQFSIDSEADSAWINVLGALKVEVQNIRHLPE